MPPKMAGMPLKMPPLTLSDVGAADLKSAAAYGLNLVGGGGVSAAWTFYKTAWTFTKRREIL